MVEVWKDIPDTDGQYQVSNYGRVRSVYRRYRGSKICYKTKILKTALSSSGYPHFHVIINGRCVSKKVHRFVAEAFVENTHNKPFVNHIDGDKTNNICSNLEWVTAKENAEHSIQNNLTKRPVKNIPVAQYSLEGDLIYVWRSAYEASAALNIRHQGISQCAIGHNKSYMGYQWIRLQNTPHPPHKIAPYKNETGQHPTNCRKVKQTRFDGSITEWNSLHEAARHYECCVDKIYKMVSGRTKNVAYDSIWEYAD